MAALQALKNIKRDASAAEKPKDFPAMLDAWKGEIARALPRHLNPDRMARIALTAFRRTPSLGNCDPRSVFAAVIQASQLGLEPDTLGRSFLIPYGNECQFVPGWKGLVDLVNRSGTATVYTGVIFKDQSYTFRDGSTRALVIGNETELDDSDDITHAFAVGWVKGSLMPIIELWRVAKIRKHRDRYNKVGKRHYSYEQWEMYARKVPLLQVLKYMPMSPELAAAIALNDAAEIGEQHLTLQDAIDGTWAPVADEEIGEGRDGESKPDAQSAEGASKAGKTGAAAARAQATQGEGQGAPAFATANPKLDAAIKAMEKTTTAAALDEAYIRAESDFRGTELEALMRAYRRIKAGIGSLI